MAAVQNTGPPDRWLGCPTFGEVISDIFLPMKTLLSDDIPVPADYKFTPQLFLEKMKERNINVGLVINLTFSSRYYEGDELIDDFNIEYKQITCRGHNEAPQPRERAEFIRVCNTFIPRNPGKVIAVHCTHGFNRTGFMICCYLCSERDWSIDAAVTHFANKRPPGIYKQDYLNELAKIYGDADDPEMEAPPRPSWDVDESLMASMFNEEGDEYEGQGAEVLKQEFYEGITDVHLVRDEALKQRIYRHCCSLLNYQSRGSGVSFPGAQPVSMDRENVQLLAANRYMVSWKADGCRYMLYIQDEDNIFFLTRSLQLWRVIGLRFPQVNDLHSHLTDTLLDGEMVTDIFDGQHIPKYLIYDVICLNGQLVAQNSFDKRCGKIRGVIVEARRKAKQAQIIPREGEPFKVADKGFYGLEYARKTWEMKVTHEKDGLIFQPIDKPYTGGTCHDILKWKPPNLNSIDFRLVIREERQNGCLPESWAYLHVSNKKDATARFKLDRDNQSYRQYHNKIVEMTLDNGKWNIIRERTDKLTPNSYETAAATFKSIRQPVTEAYLFDYIAKINRELQQQQTPVKR